MSPADNGEELSPTLPEEPDPKVKEDPEEVPHLESAEESNISDYPFPVEEAVQPREVHSVRIIHNPDPGGKPFKATIDNSSSVVRQAEQALFGDVLPHEVQSLKQGMTPVEWKSYLIDELSKFIGKENQGNDRE